MATRYQGTETEKRALNAVITLMRAANAVNARLADCRSGDGVTLSQFAVFDALLHCGPLCQKELAGKLLVSGANITKVIDVMEREGWVRRLRGERDRRYITVDLTQAGRRKISGIFPRHVRDVVNTFSPLSSAEQESLRRLCRKLGTNNQQEKSA